MLGYYLAPLAQPFRRGSAPAACISVAAAVGRTQTVIEQR
jgi:hypothetical protein